MSAAANRAALATVAACLCIAVPAADARGPVYRDPPRYRGISKAPPTKAPPQVRPAPATLSGTGANPDLVVDEAGTAHIVWNEGRGEDSDAAVYCRLKRGARECDTRATLTWNKSYGTGDGPQYNIDYLGPRIVRVGDQLVVLSRRSPTAAQKPDGASHHTTIAWTSNDGGTTWPAADEPAVVGKFNLGRLVVMGPPEDPTILNLAQDPACATGGKAGMCIEAYKSGQYSKDWGDLSTDRNQAYSPALALGPDGLPVAGFTDSSGNAFVRRWSGRGSVIDPDTWSQPVSFTASELSLAGGPSGVYAMGEPDLIGQPYEIRRVELRGDGGTDPGPPARMTDSGDVIGGRIVQDPSGRLMAAWLDGGGNPPGVVLRASSPGAPLAFGEQ